MKAQWTEPIAWSEDWRARSYAIPTGGVLGTGATDFFCTAVETGSKGLVALLRNPTLTLLALAGLFALIGWALTRTTWKPVAPLRLARRRSWGQILAAAGRMYVKRTRLFLGIGLLLIPLGFVISLVEALVLGGFGLLGVETTGESAGALVLLVATVGTTLALLGLALVQAATACALVELDEGRDVGPAHACRLALPRFRPLAGGLALAVAASLVADRDGRPHPRRDLARSSLGTPRPGRRARGRGLWAACVGAPSSCAAVGSAWRLSSGSAPHSCSSPARSSAHS